MSYHCFDSIIEGQMPKELKRRLKDKGQLRTIKMIEEQKKKEEFFAQITVELEAMFPKQYIEFLFDHTAKNRLANRIPKWLASESTELCSVETPSQNIKEENNFIEESYFKKMDPQLFHSISNPQKMAPVDKISKFQYRKCLATPKGRQPIFRSLPKKMFEVDCRMRKNYQRVKERIIFNSRDTTFRATNSVRNTMTFERCSKTQRAPRFHTECSEEKEGVEGKIPRMLMGQMAHRQSQSTKLRNTFLESGSAQSDRKWMCFGIASRNSSDGLLRRLKHKR